MKLFEDNWQRVDGQGATREHILMTLADLDTILIKMSYLDECSSSSLISVSLDYAVPHQTGRENAYEVIYSTAKIYSVYTVYIASNIME